nr:uncharacterized protein LOC111428945 [Onthophagus taurus]
MFDKLPTEIIQIIIEQKSLGFRDLVHLSSTCTFLRKFILNNNTLWKRHYLKMWSKIPDLPEIDDYYLEITHCHHIIKTVNQILIKTNKFTKKTFKEIIKIIDSKRLNREYAVGFFVYTFFDKTDKYMIQKQTLYCLTHYALYNVIKDFFSLNVQNQVFEIAVTLLEQWIKPQDNTKIEDVQNELDKIAEEVKKFVRINHPNHPIFAICEDLKQFRSKHISNNKFSSKDSKIILESMNKVIFETMRFSACSNFFMIDNSLISKVLKSQIGSRLVLSIIYESVARRLGVNLSPYNAGSLYLLKFIEDDTPEKIVYIIDVFSCAVMVPVNEEAVMQSGLGMPSMSRSNSKEVISSILPNLSTALIIKLVSTQQDNLEAKLLVRAITSLELFLRSFDINTRKFKFLYSLDNIIEALFSDNSRF